MPRRARPPARRRVAAVTGTGSGRRRSPGPTRCRPTLGFAADGGVWVKDETGNVAGSHKARHLVSVLLHLKAAELLGVGGREAAAWPSPRAGTPRWPRRRSPRPITGELEVFVPAVGEPVGRRARCTACGPRSTVCPRRDDDPPGDPCVHRFREAVAAGAVPFGVQGPENALVPRRRSHPRLGDGRRGRWRRSTASSCRSAAARWPRASGAALADAGGLPACTPSRPRAARRWPGHGSGP